MKFKTLIRLGLITLIAGTLAGCGSDGSDGSAGAPGATGPAGAAGPAGKDAVATVAVNSNTATPTSASTAAWAALAPQVTVQSVTIASTPVVNFTVKDAAGKPVVGLGNTSQSATATVPSYPNLAFALAKLVPGTSGAPSKWVSYLVTTIPTKNATTGAITASVPTRPSTDNAGTLVDNGNGSYTYTFYRDITKIKDEVAAATLTAPNVAADLGDLTYDANAVHRLVIQLSGNAPGTGSNTPNAVTVTPGVAMENPANGIYDFIPAKGPVAATDPSRDIVATTKCNECHGKIGVTTPHGGRVDTRYCVVCHNDQRKYGRTEATTTATGFSGSTYRIGGNAVGNFPVYIHKIHMGEELTKTGYNYANVLFNEVTYPQDIRNCTKCHDGSATSSAKTANGDNWKNAPSRLVCGACHDGINFATGTGTTAAGATTGHIGGAKADDSQCVLCHGAVDIALYHPAKLPATADASKRTMAATISGVAIGTTDGSVTVTFSITDNGVAVTDMTKFTKPSVALAKLVPAANGESSHWVSYTSRFRTKSATMAPVLQGNKETAGTLTANANGTFSYKFALLNGSTPGDIRTITHAHNVSTIAPYATTSWTGAGATEAGTGVNVVPYEPTLTHRVAMLFTKVGTPAVDNATNAYFDFVPAGGAVTTTRNIVTMRNCDTCHTGGKLHEGYATEYCVMCHNQSTFDPFTAETVDLQRLIHKVHMGADLPSVQAGGTYVVNGTHDYSATVFPGELKDCANACHKQTATKVGSTTLLENRAAWETTPTSRACGACHDSTAATAHITSQISGGVETCAVCHGTSATLNVKAVHSK